MSGKAGSLRIIAGSLRGRRVKTIDAPGTRPMTDRVRENLFNILAPYLPGANFLDLFAGSGAVGIEALSRGASRAVFVEYSRKWFDIIQENLAATAMAGPGEALYGDAYALVPSFGKSGDTFDIVFIGSPYDENHHNRMLVTVIEAGIVAGDGLIVLQYRAGDPLTIPEGYTGRTRTYGITSLTFIEKENTDE